MFGISWVKGIATGLDSLANAQQPGRFRIWWALPFAVFVGLIVLGLFIGDTTPREEGTSYHPAKKGFRGCYELLDELGYPVKRSHRLEGNETVRWLLSPRFNPNASHGDRTREAERMTDWVKAGGRLVLATSDANFARDLGLTCETRPFPRPEEPRPATVAGSAVRIKPGTQRVVYPLERGQTWGLLEGQPIVTVVGRGKGEIWLVHYPELFTNEWIEQGDNAVVVCRLAEATLKKKPGQTQDSSMTIDEYFHGLRERPGMIELLFTRPVLWITLAAMLLLLMLLWRNVPRFGPLRLAPPMTRRSKEEFLDAMALLLQRKQDRLDALNSVRRTLLREMARRLSMPGDAEPEDIAQEAVRQRAMDEDRLMKWLAGRGLPGGDRPEAFVEALQELERIRNECFSVSATTATGTYKSITP